MEQERWLTVEDVAQIARVHPHTVRRWLRDGTLRGNRLSRRAGWRIRASELERFLNGTTEETPAGKRAA